MYVFIEKDEKKPSFSLANLRFFELLLYSVGKSGDQLFFLNWIYFASVLLTVGVGCSVTIFSAALWLLNGNLHLQYQSGQSIAVKCT